MPLLRRLPLLLVLAWGALLACGPLWDTDVWWHLAVGKWIAAHRAVPHVDVLSCLPDVLPWRAMTWLFELCVYGVHRLGGATALRLFTALLVLAAYAAWYRFFRARTGRSDVAVALVLLLVVLYDDRVSARPHVVNTLAEALLALFCLHGARLRGWPARAGFFAAWVLWANLHDPATVLGCALLVFQLLWQQAIARATRSERPPVGETLAAPALAALAVVCTPYGFGLLQEGFKNARSTTPVVDEFQPVLSYLERSGGAHHVLCGTLPWIALFVTAGALVTLVLRRRLDDPERAAWLASGGAPLFFLAQSLTSMRFVYLCVAPLAWLCAAAPRRRIRAWMPAAAALGLFVVSYQYSVIRAHGGFGALLGDYRQPIEANRYPEIATALVKETAAESCVFPTAGFGGWVEWWSDRPAALDARFNVSPDRIALDAGLERACGRDAAPVLAALDAFRADLAILPSGCFPFDEPPATFVSLGGDEIGEAFLRTTSPDLGRVARALGLTDEQATRPADVAAAAQRWSHDRFARSHADELDGLSRRTDHESFHRRIELERLSGRDTLAIRLEVDHLRTHPDCLTGALELTRLHHARGEYDPALRLLAPAERLESVPLPVAAWIIHLRSHLSR